MPRKKEKERRIMKTLKDNQFYYPLKKVSCRDYSCVAMRNLVYLTHHFSIGGEFFPSCSLSGKLLKSVQATFFNLKVVKLYLTLTSYFLFQIRVRWATSIPKSHSAHFLILAGWADETSTVPSVMATPLEQLQYNTSRIKCQYFF